MPVTRVGPFLSRALAVAGLLLAAPDAGAQSAKHFTFGYDQPHTTAYGFAGDTFAAKLNELSKGTMIIDQFPGAQLGQEPQMLQKIRTGDIDFIITATANAATVVPEAGVFSIHFIFRNEDHLKKSISDPGVVAAFAVAVMMKSMSPVRIFCSICGSWPSCAPGN